MRATGTSGRIDLAGTNCFRHPHVPAAGTCLACGRPLCLDCSLTKYHGQAYYCSQICAGAAAVRTPAPPAGSPVGPRNLWQIPFFHFLLLTVVLSLTGAFLITQLIAQDHHGQERPALIQDQLNREPETAPLPAHHPFLHHIAGTLQGMGADHLWVRFLPGAVFGALAFRLWHRRSSPRQTGQNQQAKT